MLALKHIPVSSFDENIAYLNKDCSIYKIDNIKSLTRVEIHGGKTPVYAFLQIVEGNKIVKPNELGLNSEAFEKIGSPEGTKVSLSLATPAPSLAAVKRKVLGNVLSAKDYAMIVEDIANKRYSNADIAAFLVAVGSFFTPSEVVDFTEVLAGQKVLEWEREDIVVDYACIDEPVGGKTDLLTAAIVAAYGLPMPKIVFQSSNIGSSLINAMKVFAGVDLSLDDLKKQVWEKRAAVVSADMLDICPADKIITQIERQSGIYTMERNVASMIANKIAAGVTHLLVDIPVGVRAKIKNTSEAMRLRKLIEYVCDICNVKVDIAITDGSEPLGNGIGAVLEARDVMKILKNEDDAPEDLKEKSLFVAGRILEFDDKLRGGQGYLVARELLRTGKALEAWEQIVAAQGEREQEMLGHLTRDVVARKAGKVKRINANLMNKIAILAGAGQYFGAGIEMLKKCGDTVASGDVLYRIYSCNSNDFSLALNMLEDEKNAFEIE